MLRNHGGCGKSSVAALAALTALFVVVWQFAQGQKIKIGAFQSGLLTIIDLVDYATPKS